jgi:hypothetical protein
VASDDVRDRLQGLEHPHAAVTAATTTASPGHPLAHPEGRFAVVDAPDALPAEHGGIAVEVTGTRRMRRVALAPQVGVDGEPALYGWGRAIIAVPPGEYLVEAQHLEPMDTMPVTVSSGDVLNLTYWGAAGRPGTWRTATSTEPPPADRPWLLAATLRILAKVLAGGAVIGAAQVGLVAAGIPTWAAILLLTVLGIVALGSVAVSEAGAQDRALSGVEDRRLVTHLLPSPSPGGEEPLPLGRSTPPPAPPPHHGAVVLDLSFSSIVMLVRGENVVDDRPNGDGWEPPPVVRIDGLAVSSGWGRWWYPLRPGSHDVEMVEPGAARLQVEVLPGEVQTLHYQAEITVSKDETDTTVLSRSATGRLDNTDA